MLRKLGNVIWATYRVFPKPALCFGESIKVLHLSTNTAFQLSDLLRCAGDTRNPSFDGGIPNLTGRHAVLELELLNCREEVHGLGFVANSAFDPKTISRKTRLTDQVLDDAHFGGSLTLCNLIEGLARYVDNAQRPVVKVVACRKSENLPSLLLVAVATSVDGS